MQFTLTIGCIVSIRACVRIADILYFALVGSPNPTDVSSAQPQVPLSKLGRIKNIVRSSLVTLPLFVQDQVKYKTILEQIGRLNGIIRPSPLQPTPGSRRRATRRVKTRNRLSVRRQATLGPENTRRTKDSIKQSQIQATTGTASTLIEKCECPGTEIDSNIKSHSDSADSLDWSIPTYSAKRSSSRSPPRVTHQQLSLIKPSAAHADACTLPQSLNISSSGTISWWAAAGSGLKQSTILGDPPDKSSSEDSELRCAWREATAEAPKADKHSRLHTSPIVGSGLHGDRYLSSGGGIVQSSRKKYNGRSLKGAHSWPVHGKSESCEMVATAEHLPPVIRAGDSTNE